MKQDKLVLSLSKIITDTMSEENKSNKQHESASDEYLAKFFDKEEMDKMKNYRLPYEYEEQMEHRKWMEEIPYLHFPAD